MKKLAFILLVVATIVTPFVFYGCTWLECKGSDAEPSITLYYERPDTLIQVSVFHETEKVLEFYGDYSHIPINMNNDFTLYVIETSEGIDTLEINYTTKVAVESEKCGIRMNIDNLNVGSRTTFNNVDIDPYVNYFTTVRIY
ncbi:MAG: hypothetical protein OEW67_08155 [Cyclobacteriaceae bacterium]|nr:hypothetical protein [Cyclobacteriaceae bacterium]